MPLLLAGLDVCRQGVYLALPLGAGHVGGDEERPQLVLLLERDVCGGEPLGVDEQLLPGRQGAARQLRLRAACSAGAAPIAPAPEFSSPPTPASSLSSSAAATRAEAREVVRHGAATRAI